MVRNEDLWDALEQILHSKPMNYHCIYHVRAHQGDGAVLAGIISQQDKDGNEAADILAGLAAQSRLPSKEVIDKVTSGVSFIMALQRMAIAILEARLLFSRLPYYSGGITALSLIHISEPTRPY